MKHHENCIIYVCTCKAKMTFKEICEKMDEIANRPPTEERLEELVKVFEENEDV
jgi:Ca2+-binding EF-hand superfamily protein